MWSSQCEWSNYCVVPPNLFILPHHNHIHSLLWIIKWGSLIILERGKFWFAWSPVLHIRRVDGGHVESPNLFFYCSSIKTSRVLLKSQGDSSSVWVLSIPLPSYTEHPLRLVVIASPCSLLWTIQNATFHLLPFRLQQLPPKVGGEARGDLIPIVDRCLPCHSSL